MNKEFYTEREASEKLRLSQSTLQSYRWRGIGPKFLKLGSRILYPALELENYINQHPIVQSTSQYIPKETK